LKDPIRNVRVSRGSDAQTDHFLALSRIGLPKKCTINGREVKKHKIALTFIYLKRL
jgi:hypothetical protein